MKQERERVRIKKGEGVRTHLKVNAQDQPKLLMKKEEMGRDKKGHRL
jgi:hypothetical protein